MSKSNTGHRQCGTEESDLNPLASYICKYYYFTLLNVINCTYDIYSFFTFSCKWLLSLKHFVLLFKCEHMERNFSKYLSPPTLCPLETHLKYLLILRLFHFSFPELPFFFASLLFQTPHLSFIQTCIDKRKILNSLDYFNIKLLIQF